MKHVSLEPIVKRRETDNYIAVWTCLTTRVTLIFHSLVARVRIFCRLRSFNTIYIIRCCWKNYNKTNVGLWKEMYLFIYFFFFVTFWYYRNIGIFLIVRTVVTINVRVGEWRAAKNENYRTQLIVFIVDFVIVLFIVQYKAIRSFPMVFDS